VETTTRRRRRLQAVVLIASAFVTAVAASAPAAANADRPLRDLLDLRQATAPFHDLANAEDAGYGLFTDAAGLACIADHQGRGAMGVHYVNRSLVGDGVVDPLRPEALLYAQTDEGMRLTGVEYVVLVDTWGADRPPPELFGHQFHKVPDGNRYGIPAFYELHVWLWYDNPSGTFDDWNPRVHCLDGG
jgi:hypothetical protein